MRFMDLFTWKLFKDGLGVAKDNLFLVNKSQNSQNSVHICRGLGMHFIMIKREDDIQS